MAEITAAGYTQLRTGSPINTWFIEFRDDQDDPVTLSGLGGDARIDDGDDRLDVSDDTGNQTVNFVATLTGDDVSPGAVDLPVTVTAAVLYASDSGGPPLTEVEPLDPAPFTFGADTDEVTITFPVEAPQQD